MILLVVDTFSAARAFFFTTRGSPFSVTHSLRVRLRLLSSMGSFEVLEKHIVVCWIDSDGWIEEMLDDKMLDV